MERRLSFCDCTTTTRMILGTRICSTMFFLIFGIWSILEDEMTRLSKCDDVVVAARTANRSFNRRGRSNFGERSSHETNSSHFSQLGVDSTR
jgi:hypothetical protein